MPDISKDTEMISIFLKAFCSQQWTKNGLERGELTETFLRVGHN